MADSTAPSRAPYANDGWRAWHDAGCPLSGMALRPSPSPVPGPTALHTEFLDQLGAGTTPAANCIMANLRADSSASSTSHESIRLGTSSRQQQDSPSFFSHDCCE